MAALPGRTGNDRFTGEQAALRRVATLVAGGAPPEEVFTAVTEEAGRLLHAGHATMARYGPADMRTIVASWSSTGAAFPVGGRASLGGRNVSTMVSQTHRAARIDDYGDGSGPITEAVRELGFRAAVGVPVSVEGCLWGVMAVLSRKDVRSLTGGLVPIVRLDITPEHRRVSTVRHNRARGVHGVLPMADLVAELQELGVDPGEIGRRLEMDPEEVSRLADRGVMLKRGRTDGVGEGWTV